MTTRPVCLVLDDNAVKRNYLGDAVQYHYGDSVEVQRTEDNEQAKQVIDRHAERIYVLLADYDLQGECGIDTIMLLRSVQEDRGTIRAKIALVSSYAGLEGQQCAQEAIATGADASISMHRSNTSRLADLKAFLPEIPLSDNSQD